jgi:isochorismate synthase EntC
VLLEPLIEVVIDAQGVRCTTGTIDPTLHTSTTDMLLGAPAAETIERGLVRWSAWRGENEASFSERLTRAIAATRGRKGKVIVSRRFERDIGGQDAIDLLRLLGTAEPRAAATHYVELPGGLISMGTSPENIVELDRGQLSIDAVAGTRPRSGDAVADAAFQADLLGSTKERHEHGMAVERALAFAHATCESGTARPLFTRQVRQLRAVQHLHSRVGGRLAPGIDFSTLLGRCHPPLDSYPPQLAAQFAPPWPGHFYGGMVGRVSAADGGAFLNLRCLEIEAQRVNVYAGVGIVDGSSLEAELAEVRNKLATVTDVIERWLLGRPSFRGFTE